MLSLAIDLALFKRLTGWPLDSQGRPQVDPVTKIPLNRTLVGPPRLEGVPQPSYGMRIPTRKMGVPAFDLKTSSPETVKIHYDGFEPDVFDKLPVYWEGTIGRDWEAIWPCVIFGQSGVLPGSTFVYYDDIVLPEPGSPTVTIDGKEVPLNYRASPHPEQKNLTYVFRIFAKKRVELSLATACFERLFPERTALFVERADGSVVAYDMFRYNVDDLSYRPNDKERSLVGDERFYGMAYSYRIEAYDDPTVRAFGDQFSQEQYDAVLLSYVMAIVEAQQPALVVTTETVEAELLPRSSKELPMPSPQNVLKTVNKTPLVLPGISTAISGMQGVATWGPEDSPFLVTSPSEFEEKAGKRSATYPWLYDAAMMFFENGGRQLYINRTVGTGGAKAAAVIQANAADTIDLSARHKGARGNLLARKITRTTIPAGVVSAVVAAGSTTVFPVGSPLKFNVGDQVLFTAGADVKRGIVAAINGSSLVLEQAIVVPVGGYSTTTTVDIENYRIDVYDSNVLVSTYLNLQTSPNSPLHFATVVQKDDYRFVDAVLHTPAPTMAANTDMRPATDANPVLLTGGADGAVPTDAQLKGSSSTFTGVWAWEGARDPILLSAPGILSLASVTVDVYKEYETYVRYRSEKSPVVFLADPPSGTSPSSMKTWWTTTYGPSFRSVATWYPWLKKKDPATAVEIVRPPSPAIMGLVAAAHKTKDIAQAPAGDFGKIFNVLGTELSVPIQEGDPRYDDLYSVGVNCIIRIDGGSPATAWGNSTADILGSFAQFHKNLVFCIVHRELKRRTQFIMFAGNTPDTRAQVERVVRGYFKTLYNAGVLDDSEGEEMAYFVQCDAANNTPSVRAQRRLVARYGIRVKDSIEFGEGTLEQDTRALEAELNTLQEKRKWHVQHSKMR